MVSRWWAATSSSASSRGRAAANAGTCGGTNLGSRSGTPLEVTRQRIGLHGEPAQWPCRSLGEATGGSASVSCLPALVAQLDRASDYGSEGWGFESLRARRKSQVIGFVTWHRLEPDPSWPRLAVDHGLGPSGRGASGSAAEGAPRSPDGSPVTVRAAAGPSGAQETSDESLAFRNGMVQYLLQKRNHSVSKGDPSHVHHPQPHRSEVAGSGRAVLEPAPRRARQHDPQRRPADAGRRARRVHQRPAVDRRLLRPRVRRAPSLRRQPGRPLRASPLALRRDGHLRRRLGAGGVLRQLRLAHRHPGLHGPRGGVRDAGHPVDHHQPVHRSQGARSSHRRLGRRRRARRRHRPDHGRLAARALLVGIGVPGERAVRRPGPRGRVPAPAGVTRPRPAPPRPRRRRAVDRRPDRPGVDAHRGAAPRLDRCGHPRRARRRGRRARGLHRLGAPHRPSDARPRLLRRPALQRGHRVHHPGDVRHVRLAVRADPAAAVRVRLLRPPGGHPDAADRAER